MYEVTNVREGVYAIEDESVRMYLICGTEKALLIDTGFGSGNLPEKVASLYDGPVIVAHTHTHFDHIGGDHFFDAVYVNEAEWDCLREQGADNQLLPLNEGDTFDLGDRVITAYETPGHTEMSMSFLDKANRLFFTGDNVSDATVYICLPGADIEKYEASVKKIIAMKDAYDVLLGCHGSIEQSARQAQKMLDCIQAIRSGTASSEIVNAYDDFWFDRRSIDGASIFLPVKEDR